MFIITILLDNVIRGIIGGWGYKGEGGTRGIDYYIKQVYYKGMRNSKPVECIECHKVKKHFAKGKCKLCYCKKYIKQWRQKTGYSGVKRASKKWRDKVKIEVFTYYSNGQPQCACCGESHLEFLSIDHVDSIKNHSKGLRGTFLTQWLKRMDYPPGYRILCYNCNLSLGHFGYCPHDHNGKLLL